MENVTKHAFLNIWTKPRETIRAILNSGRTDYIYLLAIIGGITNSLSQASGQNTGDGMSFIGTILLGIIMGVITGILSLYIGAALLSWTGKWIGGQGSFDDIKIAYAWANVPLIITLILTVTQLLIFGEEMFTSATPKMDSSPGITMLFFIIDTVIMIWGIIIFLKVVAEAHRFSAWKALGNLILSTLVVLVPILVIVVLIIGIV